MEREKLQETLRLHKMWLNDEVGGVKADLSGADLRRADLRGADLRGADLRRANLRRANLRDADLRNANLSGANLDYSSLSFSCKTLHMITGDKIKIQYLFHCAKQKGGIEDKDLLKLLNSPLFIKVCNKFHRTEECGKIEKRAK